MLLRAALRRTPARTGWTLGRTMATEEAPRPVAVLVTVEIKTERLEEFRKVIELDAVGSRAEPGCLGFDVLQDQAQDNKFYFYEKYTDPAAVAFHKETPHYKAWGAFKESGGVASQSAQIMHGLFMTPVEGKL